MLFPEFVSVDLGAAAEGTEKLCEKPPKFFGVSFWPHLEILEIKNPGGTPCREK